MNDIQSLKRSDPRALATVLAFLQEANSTRDLNYRFTSHGDVDFSSYKVNVKGWVLARANNHNLFRIRVLNSPATYYRIVYGYDWHRGRIGVLAIIHKDDFDYGLDSEIANRILDDWEFATGGRAT